MRSICRSFGLMKKNMMFSVVRVFNNHIFVEVIIMCVNDMFSKKCLDGMIGYAASLLSTCLLCN